MSRLSLAVAALPAFAFLPWTLAQHGPVPIEPLLRNSDPRLIALGAWETFKRQDDSFTPLLVEMVERWDPEQRHDYDDDRYDEMTVVLDVLIQRNQAVSPAGVKLTSRPMPKRCVSSIGWR